MLEKLFKLRESGTDVRTEVLAGLTTVLTMVYIIFVNPAILGDAGLPKESVFVATCIVAALGTAVMGLYANYPIAMAPGMGLNAYFAYAVVLGMGIAWPAALGAVFISGCLFILVSLLGLRGMIVDGIPRSMRVAIRSRRPNPRPTISPNSVAAVMIPRPPIWNRIRIVAWPKVDQ